MGRLRLRTAGESHGPAVCAILDGMPHGVRVDKQAIDADLRRRQQGYGRSGRMQIEHDEVEVLAGLRDGRTLGTPLALVVRNRDHSAWSASMDPFHAPEARPLTRPRPGHADLAGALKLGLHDARDVLERSSARSTVARVAAGAVARALLRACGVEVMSHVVRIGPVTAPSALGLRPEEIAALRIRAEEDAECGSGMRCADPRAAAAMRAAVMEAQQQGDSIGGVVEVVAWGLPPGLGRHDEWDGRLDGRLAQAAMSVQAIKAVEIGLGLESASRPGSAVHDPILYQQGRFLRPSNNAGGIEGGLSNGEPIIIRAAMKPIPTLARPLASVDLVTKEPFPAQKERTDSCAVPAAAVVVEAAAAWVLCDALLDKTGGDTLNEVLAALARYWDGLRRF
ncbi:MAG: chorismate synthase [Myxococcales bacterium]|nr:chorismate synthase [Myxococcota bacterium]MDW8283795.1 chorismate synthase [Myxococcales bacterium]